MEFLKRLFSRKKEETISTYYLKPEELQDFFEDQVKEKVHIINEQFESIFQGIENELDEVRVLLDGLMKEGLQNEKIPAKAYHYLKGNRIEYEKRVLQFIDSYHRPLYGYESSITFIKEMRESIEQLSKSIYRPSQILKEFFLNTIQDLNEHLKSINEFLISMQLVMKQQKFNEIDQVNELFKIMTEQEKVKFSIDDQIESLKEKKQSLNTKAKTLEKQIEKIKEKKEYETYSVMQEEKKHQSQKLDDAKSRIRKKIDGISKALEKYKRQSVDVLSITKLLESPVSFILDADEKQVLTLLEKFKRAIHNNELELKDKVKDKTLKILATIDSVWIREIKKECIHAKEKLEQINKQIASNITILQMNELYYKKDHQEQLIDSLDKQIEELQKKKEKKQLKQIHEEVVQLMSQITQLKIQLSD